MSRRQETGDGLKAVSADAVHDQPGSLPPIDEDDAYRKSGPSPPTRRTTRSDSVGINILVDDYLPVEEVARRLYVSHKTVRRRMTDGTWEKGVVWFQPPGTHPRLSWKAVVAWQRGEG